MAFKRDQLIDDHEKLPAGPFDIRSSVLGLRLGQENRYGQWSPVYQVCSEAPGYRGIYADLGCLGNGRFALSGFVTVPDTGPADFATIDDALEWLERQLLGVKPLAEAP